MFHGRLAGFVSGFGAATGPISRRSTPASFRALARYKAQGVWAENPRLSEEGFARLRRALLGSGFLKRQVPFAECADNTFAEEAVAETG